MTRIRRGPPALPKPPSSSKTPAVKAQFKAKLKKILDAQLKGGQLQFQRDIPMGVRFIRVPLKSENHPDGFQYTALIPTGALAPNAKHTDPNKAPYFFVERSGGFAGITQFAGPIKTSGSTKPQPFFDKFLEGQQPANPGRAHTMKAPSDNEDGGGGRVGGGGGTAHTMKAPSDNEDGGGGRVEGPGGTMRTMKFPSDNEDGGGGGGAEPVGGGVRTMKYPSDNEDGGGGTIN